MHQKSQYVEVHMCHMHACAWACSHLSWTQEKFFKKRKVFKEHLKSSTTDRNRELVPGSWSLAKERVLTIGLHAEGWYSKYSGVCKRAELPGRSIKVKKVLMIMEDWWEMILKQRQNLYSIICSTDSQGRDWSMGVIWADLKVLKMSLAALFWIFWNLERRYLGQPTKSELQ